MIEFRTGDLAQAFLAHQQIAELQACPGPAYYAARIGDAWSLALIAVDGGTPVGFKLGYALDATTFYSWLGGVSAACRGKGVASRLLEMQERIVAERGYTRLRVKSMNRYPDMIRLLVKHGYAIVAVEDGGKIAFEKSLLVVGQQGVVNQRADHGADDRGDPEQP